MKGENEFKKELLDLRRSTFKEIELVLKNYDYVSQDMLSSFVAAICDVDECDMLSSNDNAYISQTRRFYWYALRYMTHDTYQRISERTVLSGCRFTKDGIRKGIEMMSSMIESDPLWTGRWIITKKMIKLLQDPHSYQINDFSAPMPQKYKLSLSIPKEWKENVEIEIKEKI